MDEDQSIDMVVEERDNIDNESCYTAEQESTVNKILEHGQDYYKILDVSTEVSEADLKKAYRQLAVHSDHLRFSWIAVWHAELGAWRFGLLRALAFGETAAVLQFNRYPALLVAVLRRWLAIPCSIFYDDFKIIDLAAGAVSAAECFDRILAVLGWRVDVAKSQPVGSICSFLGGNRGLYRLRERPCASQAH